MAKLSVDIVTAEGLVYSGEADVVAAPGVDGQLGILPSHAPLLARLEPGGVTIRSDGEEFDVALTGGFIEVLANRVVILASAAEQAAEVDQERAERALARAQERVRGRGLGLDLARAQAAMQRSRVRLRVARRRIPRVAAPRGG